MPVQHQLLIYNSASPGSSRVRLAGRIDEEFARPSQVVRFASYPTLIVIQRGTGRLRVTGKSATQVQEGDAVLVRPGTEFLLSVQELGEWTETYVIYEGVLFDQFLPETTYSVLHWTEKSAMLLSELIGSQNITVQTSCLLALLNELTVSVHAESTTWVDLAKSLLTDRNAIGRPLAEIASELGMSEQIFRKRFAALVGIPPIRYRTQARLETAQMLLGCTRLTNREIAASLGFSDEFHFSKAFTQAYKQNPSAYRRQLIAAESSP